MLRGILAVEPYLPALQSPDSPQALKHEALGASACQRWILCAAPKPWHPDVFCAWRPCTAQAMCTRVCMYIYIYVYKYIHIHILLIAMSNMLHMYICMYA